MKKILFALILLVSVTWIFSSCNSNDNSSDEKNNTNEIYMNEKGSWSNGVEFEILEHGITSEIKSSYITYTTQNKFIVLKLQVYNGSSNAFSADATDVWLSVNGSKIYQQDFVERDVNGFSNINQSPTTTKYYSLIFEVGNDISMDDLKLVVHNGSTMKSENIVINLKNSPKDCTVVLDYAYERENDTYNFYSGTTVYPSNFPTPEREGYEFLGWYFNADYSGECLENKTLTQNQSLTLYAKWKKIIHINYHYQYENKTESVLLDEKTNYSLVVPFRLGYKFDGWFLNSAYTGDTITELTNPQADVNVFARWTANKYYVSFDVNGGNQLTTNTKEVVFDQNFVFPVATRTEATFIGWFDSDGKQYANNQGLSILNWDVVGNTTLYAHYKINEYPVDLSENIDVGGVICGSGLKEYGSEVTLTAQAKSGYSFVGWYNDGNLVSNTSTYSFKMPNYPISYVAKWKANTYTITLNVNGGTALLEPTQDVTFDSSFSIPTTSRTGYTFSGWYIDLNGMGQQITDNAGNSVDVWDIAENTTVYAKWNVINYKINYLLNDGENHPTNPSTYNIEDDDIALNYPTKKGYTFNGWVISGATTAEKTMIITSGSTGEKTYAASWIRGSSFVPISSAQELQNIANNPSGYYYLTKDIDLSSFDWSPIPEFNGVLDGNGFSVLGLTFTSNDIVQMSNWVQLALILENRGKIENLYIKNATISLGTNYASAYFAVLSVFNYGTIHNCFVDVNIDTYGGSWGTIAYNNDINGIISNCYSSGVLDGDEATAGGIVGYNEGIIKNCHSDMTLKAIANTAQQDVLAGICATNGSAIAGTHSTIENCFFTGIIENGYHQYGIAYNYGTQGSIKNCFVDATIGNPRDIHFGSSYTIANVADSLSINNCYYSNTMNVPSNITKTGTAINGEVFKEKEWLKTNLGYYQFLNEVELCLDGSNVWIFTEDDYPKLYWE